MTSFGTGRETLFRLAVAASIAAVALSGASAARANPIFDSSAPGFYNITVPITGVYDTIVAGAAGGSTFYSPGGQGAEISGDVYLTAGQTLTIGIGAQGLGGYGPCDPPGEFF